MPILPEIVDASPSTYFQGVLDWNAKYYLNLSPEVLREVQAFFQPQLDLDSWIDRNYLGERVAGEPKAELVALLEKATGSLFASVSTFDEPNRNLLLENSELQVQIADLHQRNAQLFNELEELKAKAALCPQDQTEPDLPKLDLPQADQTTLGEPVSDLPQIDPNTRAAPVQPVHAAALNMGKRNRSAPQV